MLDIFFNYAVQAFVSGRNGIICPPLFCFADYVDCRLVVFDSGMARMDLSHVVSWGGAIDVDENSGTDPLVRLLPGLFNASGAANGEILFPIDCNTIEFLTRITKKATGSLEVYGYDSSDKRVIRVKVPVDLGLPNDLPGDHEPGKVPPSAVRTLNGLPGNVVIKTAAGEALPAENGVIALPEIEPGISLNGLTGEVVLADADGNPLPVDGQKILIETGGTGFDGLFPDRNPVAQIPVLDATLGVCHYLDATFTEISLAYPVWKLVEIRALACSVNPAITGTVEITPYIDDIAQTPVTINVGATWAAVTIPLAVENGEVRLVRTGGTLADGSWVTAAFRGITAMVTI